MSERSDRTDETLRDVMQRLPVPPVSRDFDARVLDAVRQPVPRWHSFWEPVKAMLPAAACSLTVMLAIIALAGRLPASRPSTAVTEAKRMIALDRILDNPNLTAGSLFCLSPLRQPVSVRPKPATPPRRSQRLHSSASKNV